MGLNKEHKGLKLPSLYLKLVDKGKWKSPGIDEILKVIPFLNDPLMFIDTQYLLEIESAGFPKGDMTLREGSGSAMNKEIRLPWIDNDFTLFIAVNEQIGDDIGIALDYRETADNPRVVASNWTKNGVEWEVVATSFDEFVRMMKIEC